MATYPFVDSFAALAPRITGGTSVISSATLIYLIMRSDAKLYTIYHRIMFGMSVADILASSAMGLSTLPMPTEMEIDYGFVGMRLGNAQTCQAQGFFFVFGITMMYAYNGSLCVYYACVIAFKMKEQNIIKSLEPFMHLVPIVLALSFGIPPFFFDAYWATGWEGWCTFAPGDSHDDNTKQMIRNASSIVLMVLIISNIIVVVSCFALIIWRILLTQRILQNATTTSSNDSDNFLQRRGQLLNAVKEVNHVSKVIFVQAIAYIGASLITLTTPLLHTLIGDREGYWVIKLQVILMPLQGLFNLMIYIGHRIYNYRRVHPDVSKCEVFCKLFTGNANDDTLFTRISLLEIDSDEQNMRVRVENENNDVDHINIQLREKYNDDDILSNNIGIEAPCSVEELSSIRVSEGREESSYNDSMFQTSADGMISYDTQSRISSRMNMSLNADSAIEQDVTSSSHGNSTSSSISNGWWMNRLQN
jgi:hypothetical protein